MTRRTRTALLLNIGLALALTGGVDRKAAVRNRDANQVFEQQQFEAAADLYNEALTEAPDAPGISYNLGNAFYRQQQYEDAASALARGAQSDDPTVRHRSLYNLGNTFFSMGQLPEAIEAYRKALETNPDDLDTKINYEKALLMQQQQEQQQQQQQQQDEQNQDSEQQDQNSESQQGEGGEQQQEQQQQNDSQENQDSQQEQGNEEQQGESEEEQQQSGEEQEPQEVGIDSVSVPEGEMRPEEALRILEAMRDQEKELQKEKARKARARARRVEKDW